MTEEQPAYVDTHAVDVAAGPAETWLSLRGYVDRVLTNPGGILRRVLGTDPPAGFAADRVVEGERLELVGRHRFARYRLVFTVAAGDAGTELAALTYADFPGVRGRAYRAAVIGTGLHVVATRRMLDRVRRRAEARST